jgi:hypothetical protein
VIKLTGLGAAKLNPNGGVIALGHPLSCAGAKLTATIARELGRRQARYGLVTMCVGGGMGAAGIFEWVAWELWLSSDRGGKPPSDWIRPAPLELALLNGVLRPPPTRSLRGWPCATFHSDLASLWL